MNFDLNSEGVQNLMSQAPEFVLTYGLKIILAIAVYLIGSWVVKRIARMIGKAMENRGVDPTVSSFVKNLVHYSLLIMVIIAALGQLGVQTASFVAIVGAAGLAVGFALQGSLANFAAGVMLILFRPFRVGDFVQAGGEAGTVSEISILTTTLKTPDNKTIIIANSAVLGGNITNFSTEKERRVDLTVGVGYGADIKRVRTELQNIVDDEIRILKERDVTIAVAELADSSVNFAFRVWVQSPDYWSVYFDLNEAIKTRFDKAGIEIPYPQMDVHVQNQALAMSA